MLAACVCVVIFFFRKLGNGIEAPRHFRMEWGPRVCVVFLFVANRKDTLD